MNRKEKVGKLINKHLDEIGCRMNLSVPLRTKTARDAYGTSLKRGCLYRKDCRNVGSNKYRCNKKIS